MEVTAEFVRLLRAVRAGYRTEDVTNLIEYFRSRKLSELPSDAQNEVLTCFLACWPLNSQFEDDSWPPWICFIELFKELLPNISRIETRLVFSFLDSVARVLFMKLKDLPGKKQVFIDFFVGLQLTLLKIESSESLFCDLQSPALLLTLSVACLKFDEEDLREQTLRFMSVFFEDVSNNLNDETVQFLAFSMPKVCSSVANVLRDCVEKRFVTPKPSIVVLCLKILQNILTSVFSYDLDKIQKNSRESSKKLETQLSCKFDENWVQENLQNLKKILDYLAKNLTSHPDKNVRKAIFTMSVELCSISTSLQFRKEFFTTFLKVILQDSENQIPSTKIDAFLTPDARNNLQQELYDTLQELPQIVANQIEQDTLKRYHILRNILSYMEPEDVHLFLKVPEQTKQLFRALIKVFEFKSVNHRSDTLVQNFKNLDSDSLRLFSELCQVLFQKIPLKSIYIVADHFEQLLEYSDMNPSVLYVLNMLISCNDRFPEDLLLKFISSTQARLDNGECETLKQCLLLQTIRSCYISLYRIDNTHRHDFFQKSFSIFFDAVASSDDILSFTSSRLLQDLQICFTPELEKISGDGMEIVVQMVVDNFDYVINSVFISLNCLFMFQINQQTTEEFVASLAKTTDSLKRIFELLQNNSLKFSTKDMEMLHLCVDKLLDLLNLNSLKSSSNEILPILVSTFDSYLQLMLVFYRQDKGKSTKKAEESGEIFPETEDEWKDFRSKYKNKYLNSGVIKSRTGEIFHFANNILSHTNVAIQLQILDLISKAMLILKPYEDILFPYLYKLSKPLRACFCRSNVALMDRSFDLLMVISEISGDFLMKSTLKHILPTLSEFMVQQEEFLREHFKRWDRQFDLNDQNSRFFLKLMQKLEALGVNMSFQDEKLLQIRELCSRCRDTVKQCTTLTL